MEQIELFKLGFMLGEWVEKLDKQEDGSFIIIISEGI